MARLSLRALALLAAAIPAMTWSLILNMEELEQHREEDYSLGRTGSGRYLRTGVIEGRRKSRQLNADPNSTVKWIMEVRSKSGGPDKQKEAIPDRDYLNGLVAASATNTDGQESNIAFVKTRQTGSTSMAAILYRYAVRHNLKLAQVGERSEVDLQWLAGEVQQGNFQRVDIMHYEISSRGRFNRSWADARENYRGIMRDPDKINFLTVIREPRSHFISYYYYFLEPTTKLSIEDFLTKRRIGSRDMMYNPLSSEFGVTSYHQIEQLVVDEISTFKLILLTDRFDEGLMVLRRLLGWSMIDMTYMMLNETNIGSSGWDDKPIVDRPSFDDLSEKVQSKIDALTDLDQVLYTAAQVEYEKRLRSMSDVIDGDVEEFQKLQKVVSDYLYGNDSSKANAMYRAEDIYSGAPPMNLF